MKSFQKESSTVISSLMRTLDILLIVVSSYFAYYFVFESWSLLENYKLTYLFGTLVVIAQLHLFDMYRTWRGVSRFHESFNLFLAFGFSFLVVAMFLVVTKTSENISRLWLGFWFSCALASVIGYRILLNYALDTLRQKGLNRKRIALIGDLESLEKVCNEFSQNKQMGFTLAYYYVANQPFRPLSMGKYLDDVDAIIKKVTEGKVREIWIALPITEAKQLSVVMNELSYAPCSIRYVPDFLGFDLINHSVTEIGRLPVVNLSVSRIGGVYAFQKWFEDKIISALILFLISPLLVFIALGVKLTSPGPIFYAQERVSWNGKRFNMLKFRSMPVDTESNGVQWGGASSKATTKFGKFIRKTSFDELPQFINVLRGDMSIVGPRPERTEFVDKFKQEIPRYMQKHMVKGGITGWAQVSDLRGDTNLKERIDADLHYIESWSLWLDIKIIVLTVVKVFKSSAE